MRKRTFLAGLALAGLAWCGLNSASTNDLPAKLQRERATLSLRLPGAASGGDAAAPTAMPPRDERIDAFLAERPLEPELRDQLIDLARLQRVTYTPRLPNTRETEQQREARRAAREQFRNRVRDIVAAIPADTRAAMRKHRVDIVRLGQTLEAQ
jgi:hypothetical protein